MHLYPFIIKALYFLGAEAIINDFAQEMQSLVKVVSKGKITHAGD